MLGPNELRTDSRAPASILSLAIMATLASPAFALSPVIAINNEAKTASVSVTPVHEGISVLMGSGGNVTVLRGPDGILMIDGGISYSQGSMSKALALISSKPPKYLIDTHYHWDHTDGNGWLHERGAIIVAQENTVKRLSVATRVDDWEFTFPISRPSAMPTVTFAADKTLQFAGQTIELKYYGPSHTDTDIWAYFVEADVLSTGDTWWNGHYPFIDNENGGTIDGMIRAANANLAKVTEHTVIVPGHGPIGGKKELIGYRDMLVGVRAKVAALKSSGKSRSDVVAAKPTADYDSKWGGFVIDGEFFTRLVYDGL